MPTIIIFIARVRTRHDVTTASHRTPGGSSAAAVPGVLAWAFTVQGARNYKPAQKYKLSRGGSGRCLAEPTSRRVMSADAMTCRWRCASRVSKASAYARSWLGYAPWMMASRPRPACAPSAMASVPNRGGLRLVSAVGKLHRLPASLPPSETGGTRALVAAAADSAGVAVAARRSSLRAIILLSLSSAALDGHSSEVPPLLVKARSWRSASASFWLRAR